ncbi:MAG: hypothetical protein DRJ50_03640 [Actinobacteria bacterium]|nr:MAG: hypothetical protein DRJ50_03640 [Actinomycetota bacterium]
MQQLLNPTHRIRDPIYGYIWLTDTELELVDTPVFQRLRRINQLALTKYVYPTAEHSRFVHSLGVVQAATNIFYEVLRFNPDIFNNDAQELQKHLQIVRFAALLHDIGHMPFSHAAEQVFLDGNFTHEDISKYIIQNNPSISNKIKKDGIKPQIVASLLKGKPLKEYSLLKKFISGEFDADRADFLLRDSYFCGVKYGEYDYIRYAGSFRIIPDKDRQAVFAIEKGNLHAVEAFLLARYHYYLQVPFHRTRRGFDIVLERYFNDLRERGRSVSNAVQEGALLRLRPVLMTAVTTGLGLLPLLLATGPGSEIQRPLAIVVLGGLGTSTLLTLVLLPSLYAWIEGRAERRASSPLSAASASA